MVQKNTQQKNIGYLLKDTQKQISQLKARMATFSKSKGSEFVLQCTTASSEFSKYDMVKVVAGNVAEEFDGIEDYETDLLPGIVIDGNTGDATAPILVLISGVSYIKITETVTTGQLLYPSTIDYRQGALDGNVGYWKALEDGVASEYIKVNIIYGSGGGGGESVPCKITGGTVGAYTCDIHADGKLEPATGTGILQVLQINFSNTVSVGTWVIGHPTTLITDGE